MRRASEQIGLEMEHKEAENEISQVRLGLKAATEETMRLIRAYEAQKGGKLDFDDLLIHAIEVLGKKKRPLGEWTHILIDEAQDTDPAQIELIRLLAGKAPNVSIFADGNQGIFSFKGAVPEKIEREEIFPGTKRLTLLENYRSAKRIIEAGNRLIGRNGSRDFSVPVRREDGEALWIRAKDEREEARIAATIAERLIQEGAEPPHIAVLYRTNRYRADIEWELIERWIPYSVLKNVSVLKKESPFLALCLQALRPEGHSEKQLLVNYLGRHKAEEIVALAEKKEMRPLEAAVEESIGDPKTSRNLNLLFDDLAKTQRLCHKAAAKVAEKAWEIIEKRGFIVDRQEAAGAAKLIERCRDLADLRDQLRIHSALDRAKREKKMHLSTIHRAKGLEWKYVILIGCAEGILPLVTGQDDLAEERRLAYVALTRATDLFVAISPDKVLGERREPSRFIAEMGLSEGALR